MLKKSSRIVSVFLSLIMVLSLSFNLSVSAESIKKPLNLSIEFIHSDAKGQIFLYSKKLPGLIGEKDPNDIKKNLLKKHTKYRLHILPMQILRKM